MKLDYDMISPITGNKCVIVEADENTSINSYMCIETGYTTTDNFVVGSEFVKSYETQITELLKKIKYIDEDMNLVWYPAFLNVPQAGMLYCVAKNNSYQWEVAEIVNLLGEERLKYPIPGKKNEYYTSRLDTDNAIQFERENFENALDHFYGLVNKAYQNAN